MQTGQALNDEYFVDFEEPQIMSPGEEREMYTWLFQNNLATREQYLLWKNPDLLPDEASSMLEDIDETTQKPEQNRLLNRLQS